MRPRPILGFSGRVTLLVALVAAAAGVPSAHGTEAVTALQSAADAMVQQPGSNVDTRLHTLSFASRLLAIASDHGPQQRAVALTIEASRHQANVLGGTLSLADVAPARPALASARAFLAGHGEALPPAMERVLDALPSTVSEALGGVIDAFAAFETTTASMVRGAANRHAAVAAIGARARLLLAAQRLGNVAASSPITGGTLVVPPYIRLELGDADTIYGPDDEYLLQIDAFGDDVYLNSAGGVSALDYPPSPQCFDQHRNAAALIDLTGNDRYGDGSGCGQNGGGSFGAGFLFDMAGNDVYTAGSRGTNGGAHGDALGFLVDARGDDQYLAGSEGTNGGAGWDGLGLLVDGTGDDLYQALDYGTNGGTAGWELSDARGALIDGGGSDSYSGGSRGTNGGAYAHGILPEHASGFLLDAGFANDTYRAGGHGTNGGARCDAQLWILYDFTAPFFQVNAFLLDGGGDDAYTAGSEATNGGAFNAAYSLVSISGGLVDISGDDRYVAGAAFTNGGARSALDVSGLATGLLFDGEGRDWYEDPAIPNGGQWDWSSLFKGGGAGMHIDSGLTPRPASAAAPAADPRRFQD